MQKAESRKWLSGKESFHEYAMHKLKLLQNLNLPEKEAINFLINGITNPALRGMALLLGAGSTDKFLELMHELIITYGDEYKRSPPPTKKFFKEKSNGSTTTIGKSAELPKDAFCVYCRTKGHMRADCFRLKKKEQAKQPSSSSSKTAVAVVEDSAAVSEDAPSSSSSVALISTHRQP
nr:PREDICTED: uncharacterized protein LOC105673036 [Linepithema humile]